MPTYHYAENQGKEITQVEKMAKNLNLGIFLTILRWALFLTIHAVEDLGEGR